MEKRNTAPAQVFATIALVVGFLVVVLVIPSSIGGGGVGGSSSPRTSRAGGAQGGGGKLNTPAAFVVENGDTLTSIAHRTEVSVVGAPGSEPARRPADPDLRPEAAAALRARDAPWRLGSPPS